MNNLMKKYKFYVSGMHCNSCILLTETELNDHALVESAVANLNGCCVEVVGDFKDRSEEDVARELSLLVEKHGYKISTEKININKWSDFKIALPVAVGFLILFVVLQKIGLINLVNSSSVTYGTAFAIGIIASLSSCLAVVGGLLLSMSATFAKEGDKVKPQLMFHGGRLVSFFVLGGIIGAIGGVFTLSATATFIISLVIGIVMLILGINLLDVFPWAKRFQLSMPGFISKRAHGVSKLNHTLTPFLVGVATFFLPCGFTQSMQLYTLTTGSFVSGGLTMLSFALGTLPVLGLISFSSFSIQSSSKSGIFFKSAGLIVIMFALFNLLNSLAAIGFIPPIFNF
jgi:sulfite exporter TauE/SafE/copper chaperone CopZ